MSQQQFTELTEAQQRVTMRVADALFFNDPHMLDSLSLDGVSTDTVELLQNLQHSVPMPGVLLATVHNHLLSNPHYVAWLNAAQQKDAL